MQRPTALACSGAEGEAGLVFRVLGLREGERREGKTERERERERERVGQEEKDRGNKSSEIKQREIETHTQRKREKERAHRAPALRTLSEASSS